jgi:hypothetical protein
MIYRCENCKYWLGFPGSDTGYCRRFPPFLGERIMTNGHSQTLTTDWCGEYLPSFLNKEKPND